MIRHILLIRCNDATTPEVVAQIQAALKALPCPGRLSFSMGPDLGLRPGNMDLAMVADFADAASYTAYDQDEEHGRIRRELIGPIAERVERCQFEI
ncbi:MAG TPA: Dabb family protein [Acidimicrobiales bacterium]|nr:Dabb family protein [Acidimicrobiales bacterium]